MALGFGTYFDCGTCSVHQKFGYRLEELTSAHVSLMSSGLADMDIITRNFHAR